VKALYFYTTTGKESFRFLPQDAYAFARTVLSQDVCPSVRMSHAGIVSKRLNIPSNYFHRLVFHHSSFSIPNLKAIFGRDPSPLMEASNAESMKKWRFSTNISLYLRNDEDRAWTAICHFEWPWVILSDLAKYSMIWSIARHLCDSWASCLNHRLYYTFVDYTLVYLLIDRGSMGSGRGSIDPQVFEWGSRNVVLPHFSCINDK